MPISVFPERFLCFFRQPIEYKVAFKPCPYVGNEFLVITALFLVHNNSGTIHARQGKLDLALREFDAALAIYVYPAALSNKARVLAMLERWAECVDTVEQLVKLDERQRDNLRRDNVYDKLRREPTFGPRFQRLVDG